MTACLRHLVATGALPSASSGPTSPLPGESGPRSASPTVGAAGGQIESEKRSSVRVGNESGDLFEEL